MGHAPSVRASRALRPVNVRKMCVRALSLARCKSLTLAAISAALVITGAGLGNLLLTSVSAVVALAALYAHDKLNSKPRKGVVSSSAKKGGAL